MVVFVIGSGRNGTSFYTRCLHTMGAYVGSVNIHGDPINPRGHYDNMLFGHIIHSLLDILEPKKDHFIGKIYWKALSYGKTKRWYRYHTFYDDPSWAFPSKRTLRDIDVVTLSAMKYLLKELDLGGVGVVKAHYMQFTYPFWKCLLDHLGIDYTLLAVFRNPLSYAESSRNVARHLKTPAIMSEKSYINRWTIENKLIINCIKQASNEGIEVLWNNFDWPPDYMMKRLEGNCLKLGLAFDEEKSRGLFEPGLKHYKARELDALGSSGEIEPLKVYDELLSMSK